MNFELLSRVFGMTYDVMERTLGAVMVPPIVRDTFIRVCRALVLKRVQDVQEAVSGERPAHYLQMQRGLGVPQPVGNFCMQLVPTSPQRRRDTIR